MDTCSKLALKALLNLCLVVVFCKGSSIKHLERDTRDINNNHEGSGDDPTPFPYTTVDTNDIGKTIAVVWTGCIIVLLFCGCIAKCVFKSFGVGFSSGLSGRRQQRRGRNDEHVVVPDEPPKYCDLDRAPPEYESREKSSNVEGKLSDSKSEHEFYVEIDIDPPTYQDVTSGSLR